MPAGSSCTSTPAALVDATAGMRHSANPGALTISVTSPGAGGASENLPAESVVVWCSAPDGTRVVTAAPTTTRPLASWTTPEITAPAGTDVCEAACADRLAGRIKAAT